MQPEYLRKTVSIRTYNAWNVILKDNKLRENHTLIHIYHGFSRKKIQAVTEEFNNSGCVVMQSKLNLK
jgi:hypothetical protein